MCTRRTQNDEPATLTGHQPPFNSCVSLNGIKMKEKALNWYEYKIQKTEHRLLYSIIMSKQKLAILLQEPCVKSAAVGKYRTGSNESCQYQSVSDASIVSTKSRLAKPCFLILTQPTLNNDGSSHSTKYDEETIVNTSPKAQKFSGQDVTENRSAMEALYDVKASLQNKKTIVNEATRDLTSKRKALQKSRNSALIQKRSIEVCQREITNHCCQCGGIHIFSDHKPTQRKECKRLKNKTRSLMYLKQAQKEISERVNLCQVAVNSGEDEVESAQASMTEDLSNGLIRLDSLDNPTCPYSHI